MNRIRKQGLSAGRNLDHGHSAEEASAQEPGLDDGIQATLARLGVHPWRVLWGTILSLPIMASLLADHLATPPHVVGRELDVRSHQVELRWQADRDGYGVVEFFSSPDRKRRTRWSAIRGTSFAETLAGLRPNTRYSYRIGSSRFSNGSRPRFSEVYSFKTRPEIQIRDIQVVDRKPNQVTIRWSTNLETDTLVRIGQTRDYSRIVENPEQRRELDHSLVIHGLKPNTTYHYQIVGTALDARTAGASSDDKRFVTRAEHRVTCRWPPRRPHRPLRREDFEVVLHPTLPYVQGPDDLTLAHKLGLLQARSNSANFHRRRALASYWADSFLRQGLSLDAYQGHKPLPEMLEYLKSLYYVNSLRALRYLDEAVEALGRIEMITTARAP